MHNLWIFLAGSCCGALVMAFIAGASRRPAPKPVAIEPPLVPKPPDARGEALAVLELCSWDFVAAYDWAATMITNDSEWANFWVEVAHCIEIFEAGKKGVAA